MDREAIIEQPRDRGWTYQGKTHKTLAAAVRAAGKDVSIKCRTASGTRLAAELRKLITIKELKP